MEGAEAAPARRGLNPWLQRLLVVALLLGALYGAFHYSGWVLAPVGDGPDIHVEIPPGSTLSQIADRLKEAGAIRSATAFSVVARVMGESENMKAGEYALSPQLGVLEILDRLVAGDAVAHWVVLREGLTARQVAEQLEARRLGRAERFLRLTRRSPRQYGLDIPVSRRSVEGYLMPDSYKFPRHVDEETVLRHLLRNWEAKVLRPHSERFEQSDWSLDEVVTVAAMIEREARVAEDRPLIASVIRNRLRRDMPLQIDATVLYALGRHRQRVLLEDLKVDSPYNTYQQKGLPPGPICSPGLASILAALEPAETDYLFYVARPDGSHIFTRTYEEHQAAIRQVRAAASEAALTGEAGR